jgi:hypothetical protein
MPLTNTEQNGMRKADRRTVYFLAHICPVAFFRQMIALKIPLKKPHF